MGSPIEVVAALIWQGDRFLICQRPAQKARGLQWELVGGKVEPGETKQQALVRECREELDITVSVGPVFMEIAHSYPDITILLTVFHASLTGGTPQLLEHQAMLWILPEEAAHFEFCLADKVLLEKLRKEHSHGERTGP